MCKGHSKLKSAPETSRQPVACLSVGTGNPFGKGLTYPRPRSPQSYNGSESLPG